MHLKSDYVPNMLISYILCDFIGILVLYNMLSFGRLKRYQTLFREVLLTHDVIRLEYVSVSFPVR